MCVPETQERSSPHKPVQGERDMKKSVLAVLIAGFVMALHLAALCASCAGTPKPDPNVPAWINDLPPEEEMWGIGSARDDDTSIAMQTAEERARRSLARQVETSVQDMVESYERAAGAGGVSSSVFDIENVSRQLSGVTLRGAEPNRAAAKTAGEDAGVPGAGFGFRARD
jgi:hypothetical protein